MKKIIVLCLAVVFSTAIFAAPLPDPATSAKILKSFQQDFPEVSNPVINEVGDYYLVYYKYGKDNYSCRIFYDGKGKIVQTMKYYSCEELTPFIRAKIKEAYNGTKISSVTELTNAVNHYYQVILKGNKSMYVVEVDINGNVRSEKKYKLG
jgi:hypothetical protein